MESWNKEIGGGGRKPQVPGELSKVLVCCFSLRIAHSGPVLPVLRSFLSEGAKLPLPTAGNVEEPQETVSALPL